MASEVGRSKPPSKTTAEALVAKLDDDTKPCCGQEVSHAATALLNVSFFLIHTIVTMIGAVLRGAQV